MNANRRTESIDYISYGYGLAIFVGGLIGYVKAGSTFSLLAGLLFGIASLLGAFQLSKNYNNYQLALVTASVLLAVMGLRFYFSGKFMPAGLIAALSLLQVVRLGIRFSVTEKQQID